MIFFCLLYISILLGRNIVQGKLSFSRHNMESKEVKATVLFRIGLEEAELEKDEFLPDITSAINQLAAEALVDTQLVRLQLTLTASTGDCPPEESYPECRDMTADFSFVLAAGEDADEVLELFEQSVLETVSSGSLQDTLDEVNNDSPVTILGLREENEPTGDPTESTKVEAAVSFKVGLSRLELEGETFLPDLTEAVSQLAFEVLEGTQLVPQELLLTVVTGVCQPDESYAACSDVTASFSLALAAEQDAEEAIEVFEESLSLSISDGRLQEILDGLNADNPFTIFGLREEDIPTEPTAPIDIEATVSFQIGLDQAELEGEDFLPDIAAAVNQVADEVLGGTQVIRRELVLTAATSVCPQGQSFPECRDVTADFALTLANGQEAEAVVAALEESLSQSISDGSLQGILDEVSVESLVTILGLSGDEPKEPDETTEAMESVSFQIGLSSPGLQKEEFLTDITAAVRQVSADVLEGTQLIRLDLMLTAATSACPPDASFPECRDVTADFSLTLANGQDAESVVAMIEEKLLQVISDGTLESILKEVNADTPVTILGLLEQNGPMGPVETTEVEASVSFHIGLSRTGLEKEEFLTDISAAISRLSDDALANTQVVRRELVLTAATGTCPSGASFPECRNVTGDFSLTLANEENVDSVVAALEDHLALSISDGSLQAILKENNAETPVTILGSQMENNPTTSPTVGPTPSPVSVVEEEEAATVLFQIGLIGAEEELTESHLSDITDAIEEVMIQEFGDSLPAKRHLKLSASSGVCPTGVSFSGGCYDVTAVYTCQLEGAEDAETVVKVEQDLPQFISSGRLQTTLEGLNPDSPVRVLDAQTLADAPPQVPTQTPTNLPTTEMPVTRTKDSLTDNQASSGIRMSHSLLFALALFIFL